MLDTIILLVEAAIVFTVVIWVVRRGVVKMKCRLCNSYFYHHRFPRPPTPPRGPL